MQLISLLLICTAASLVTGNSVKPIRPASNWLLLNTLGSKTTNLMDSDETRLFEVISQENLKNQPQGNAADDNINGITDRRSDYNYDENVIDKKDTQKNEGVRQQQWHNYPRRLDRIERYKRDYSDNNRLDESTQGNEINASSGNKDSADSKNQGELDLTYHDMILKLRLYSLSDRLLYNPDKGDKSKRFSKDFSEKKVPYLEFENHDEMSNGALQSYLMGSLGEISPLSDEPEIKTIYVTRGRLPNRKSIYRQYSDNLARRQRITNIKKKSAADNPDDVPVSKRIFSFWTRLHGLSQSDKAMEHRRHFHAYGSYPTFDSNGDIVSAETRAALIRPAGSPLRWG